jgi:hypothetical protein
MRTAQRPDLRLYTLSCGVPYGLNNLHCGKIALFDGVTKELSQRPLRDQQSLPDPDAFYGARP